MRLLVQAFAAGMCFGIALSATTTGGMTTGLVLAGLVAVITVYEWRRSLLKARV